MTDGPDLGRAGARGGAQSLVSTAISVAMKFILLVVLARWITPAEFGVAAIAISIATLAATIVLLGLPMASAQAEQITRGVNSSLFYINASIGIAMGVVLWGTADILSAAYGEPAIGEILHWTSFVVAFIGIQVQFRMRLIRALKFGLISLLEIVGAVLGGGLALGLALVGLPYQALAAAFAAPYVTVGIGVIVAARWLPGIPRANKGELAALLRVGANIAGGNVLRNSSRYLLIPVMGWFLPASAVGGFDRAQQATQVPATVMIQGMQRVTVPIFSRLRSRPDELEAMFTRAQIVTGFGPAVALLAGAGASSALVDLLLGPSWSDVALVLAALSVASAFRIVGQTSTWLFIGSGNAAAGLRYDLASQPVLLAVSLAGLPWGAYGVALLSTCGSVIYAVSAVWMAARSARLSVRKLLAATLVGPVAVGVPSGLASYAASLLPLPSIGSLAASLASAGAVILLLVAVSPRIRAGYRTIVAAVRAAVRR